MRIVFLDVKTLGRTPNLDLLERFGDVTWYQTTSREETSGRIREADIVITNKVVLDERIIKGAEKLTLICVAATGTNNVDLAAADSRGIQVKNVGDYASKSVAQGTFAVLLHLLYNIPFYDRYVKSGEYSRSDIFTNVEKDFHEISGKRFGIIGLGNIGGQVAKIAEAFGAEIVYFSASGRNREQPYRHLELEELLSSSDIISIHAPLNDHTRNLIDYERLKLMKPSGILINTGRGGIVSESDLARALNANLIAAAAIDVFEREPLEESNPLMKLQNKNNLVLTPHMTWSSIEARTTLIEQIGRNIEEFLAENGPAEI